MNDFGVSFCADPDRVAIPNPKKARIKGHNLEETKVNRFINARYFFVSDYFAVLNLEPVRFHLISVVSSDCKGIALPFVKDKSLTLNA